MVIEEAGRPPPDIATWTDSLLTVRSEELDAHPAASLSAIEASSGDRQSGSPLF